ncbi:type III restriction endonuclease subunit M [Chelonobacter oris]|uniref:site-specific DNA-methyltransferase n=1 Tax=Chelonobacter oris TaxID=505317 RepID=UPI0024468E27|nr:site-specific DNA-methyltransferase [Chelonobacter oris]MDH3001141.1 type III restriction endonuclease subunit M [Chelonobacter oris]
MITETLFHTDNITANSPQLEQLKTLFPNCFDKDGRFLLEIFKQEIAEQTDISTEFYAMNWLGKSYAKLLRNLPPETLLAENKAHNAKPENAGSQNLLIQGDNLEVLKHLKNAYAHSVKMIYIDPPYNTGSDGFVYQDDRKFTPDELARLANINQDEAERILNFTDKGSNSHSAWLTFMYPRLYVARELLKEDGVIFISIDDNEVAQLKLLCDEVFGPGNFVAELIWSLGTGTQAGHFVRAHENILVYFKNKNLVPNFSGGDGIIEHSALKKISIKNPESDFTFPAGTRWDAPNDCELKGSWGGSEQMKLVDGIMKARDGKLLYDVVLSSGYAQKSQMKSWFSGKETFDSKGQKVLSFHFNQNGILRYEKERSIINPATVLNNIASTKNGSDEIDTLFGSKVFSFPKPSNLIKFFVNTTTTENDLILDFFAGSGTTAHAVMQLNAEDNGNRQFICVQLPEKTDIKSEAYKAGYQTIFDITKARIEKAAAKIQADNPDVKGDFDFKIYRTTDNFRACAESEFAPNQPSLPNVQTLNNDELHTLLTTWAVHDGAMLTTPIEAVQLGGYTAYLCEKRLYLMHEGFNSADLLAFIDKLDNDTDFNPNRVIIFGEHIESSMQQEINQALVTYSNRKSISLSLIVRV